MSSKPKLMRDAFLERIYTEMSEDQDIYFLTADFGAVALDRMREDFPDRVFHMGICEQNMVDFAAGLSMSGKKVFLYAMAPFLIARAYEQIKSVVSAMSLPMTFVGVGVGLGYDHATLTHFTPEDFVLSRVIRGMNVYTPSDDVSAVSLADNILKSNNELSYVRLERSLTERFSDDIHQYHSFRKIIDNGSRFAVISSGYMSHVANTVISDMTEVDISLIDVIKNYPMESDLTQELIRYDCLLVVEEQSVQGGMASSVCEALLKVTEKRPRVESLSLDRDIKIQNGDRAMLHTINGVSSDDLKSKIKEIIN